MLFAKEKANLSGAIFESVVSGILRAVGIAYTTQYVPGVISLYDKSVRVDFYLNKVRFSDSEQVGCYLQCKWQQSSGSAIEKLSALKDDILTCYDKPTIVVCGGEEIEAGFNVLKNAIGGKLVGVFRVEDFIAYAPTLGDCDSCARLMREFNADQKTLFAL